MKKYFRSLILVSLTSLLVACGPISGNSSVLSSKESSYSSNNSTNQRSSSSLNNSTNQMVAQLSTDNGLTIKFGPKGARITTIEWNNVQIAKDGFVAGRVANRIANATFELNGFTYNLNKNNGNHHLHGGAKGFGEINWTLVSQTTDQVTYSLRSADGDMGYPGTMDISVTYTLINTGELTIEYHAISDADTLINPTNHLYMSLNGNNSAQNHDLWIDAENYTEMINQIPNGNIMPVTSRLDFSTAKVMPVTTPNYDDNYTLNGDGYRKVATMTGRATGISVDVFTDRPGLQLYNTSTHICLETQLYPDAIHHDNFPSSVLKANEEFYSKTAYFFTKIVK